MTIHVRQELPAAEPRGTVLCVHGFPESSYMWRDLLGSLATAGWRALAPDLPGYGDSPYEGDGSWAAQVAALERVWAEHAAEPVVLVVHDWGGIIGLRWALEHPGRVRALVISDTGYFPDGRWHDMAKTLRTPGEGEQLIAQFSETLLAQVLGSVSTGIGPDSACEYAKAFASEDGRRGALELYRSGEFSEIDDGCLGRLDVPALVLWGESDPFAPLGGAHRFVRELPDAELVVVPGSGHFVYEDDPAACAAAITAFLDRRLPR